jgi:hypothetical protein
MGKKKRCFLLPIQEMGEETQMVAPSLGLILESWGKYMLLKIMDLGS